jgi:hypothetical protein
MTPGKESFQGTDDLCKVIVLGVPFDHGYEPQGKPWTLFPPQSYTVNFQINFQIFFIFEAESWRMMP